MPTDPRHICLLFMATRPRPRSVLTPIPDSLLTPATRPLEPLHLSSTVTPTGIHASKCLHRGSSHRMYVCARGRAPDVEINAQHAQGGRAEGAAERDGAAHDGSQG